MLNSAYVYRKHLAQHIRIGQGWKKTRLNLISRSAPFILQSWYSYVTVGEFVAFFIGWNLILEYLIGTASGASALSSMLDSLTNRTISAWSIKNLGQMHSPWQGADEYSYPDLLAMFICMIMVVVVGAGLKNSMMLNNILNFANMIVWVSGILCIDKILNMTNRNFQNSIFLFTWKWDENGLYQIMLLWNFLLEPIVRFLSNYKIIIYASVNKRYLGRHCCRWLILPKRR